MSLSPTEVSEEEFTIFENEHHSSEWRGGQWLPLPHLWDFLVAFGQTELGVPTVGMLDSTKTLTLSPLHGLETRRCKWKAAEQAELASPDCLPRIPSTDWAQQPGYPSVQRCLPETLGGCGTARILSFSSYGSCLLSCPYLRSLLHR